MAFIAVLVSLEALSCVCRGRHAGQLRTDENGRTTIRTGLLTSRAATGAVISSKGLLLTKPAEFYVFATLGLVVEQFESRKF